MAFPNINPYSLTYQQILSYYNNHIHALYYVLSQATSVTSQKITFALKKTKPQLLSNKQISNHSLAKTLLLANYTDPCIAEGHGLIQLPTVRSHVNKNFSVSTYPKPPCKIHNLSLPLIFHGTIKQESVLCC